MDLILSAAAIFVLYKFTKIVPENYITFEKQAPKPKPVEKKPTWEREDRTLMYILCPNNTAMNDLFDIRKANRKVKIGVASNNLAAYELLNSIVSTFDDIKDKVVIQSLNSIEITEGYNTKYDIFFEFIHGRSDNILALTELLPSHLLYIRELNNGDPFIMDSERKFYEAYPQYSKEVLDIAWLKKTYPYLTQIIQQNLYIPTLGDARSSPIAPSPPLRGSD